jgi:hypothetical protein
VQARLLLLHLLLSRQQLLLQPSGQSGKKGTQRL